MQPFVLPLAYHFLLRKSTQAIRMVVSLQGYNCYALQTQLQVVFKQQGLMILLFVNLLKKLLKTSMTGNDQILISSTFWSILKITMICFPLRLDWKFCPACIATANKKSDFFYCRSKTMNILKWRNVVWQSNGMYAFFFMAVYVDDINKNSSHKWYAFTTLLSASDK